MTNRGNKERCDFKSKQKTIFVHFFNSFSGSPKVLQSVIGCIADQKSILITNDTEGFLSPLNISKIIFRFNLADSNLKTLYNYFSAQIALFFYVLKVCKRNDLLYINTTIPMFASFAGKIKGAIILFHLHEDRSSLNIVHRSLSKFRKYFCDVEVFVSNYLLNREHIDGIRNFVLPNVVPLDFFEEGMKFEAKHKNDSNFNILMICSLKKYKGVFELLKVAKKLVSLNDIKFTLLVSEEQDEINNFFKGISLPANILIHAKTIDTISMYKNASLLLNLSRPDEWIETFGLTILEGMTFGLPCIVPPVGGPEELVEDGINGYKVSSYDIDMLVEKISAIYRDNKLFEYMSRNSKSMAKKYSFISFQNKLNQIIREASRQGEISCN